MFADVFGHDTHFRYCVTPCLRCDAELFVPILQFVWLVDIDSAPIRLTRLCFVVRHIFNLLVFSPRFVQGCRPVLLSRLDLLTKSGHCRFCGNEGDGFSHSLGQLLFLGRTINAVLICSISAKSAAVEMIPSSSSFD